MDRNVVWTIAGIAIIVAIVVWIASVL